MRCIETRLNTIKYSAVKGINFNMRCIETMILRKQIQMLLDKL